MQDDDIPLLTEVHVAAQSLLKPAQITPDIIATIIAQIRPQLEDEIEKSIAQRLKNDMREELLDHLLSESANIQKASQAYLSSAINQQTEQLAQKSNLAQREAELALKQYVNGEVVKAQQTIVDQTALFVDKTRADFATEIPKLLLTNVEIIKSDLDHVFSQMQLQG